MHDQLDRRQQRRRGGGAHRSNGCLPITDGFEVARRIRRNPENARTRLVALSGYGQDSDVPAALEAGFDEHLTKPPDLDRLERLLAGETKR